MEMLNPRLLVSVRWESRLTVVAPTFGEKKGELIMVKAMLMAKIPASARWEGMGQHEFAVLPRVGEHIELAYGERKDGYLFRVVAVIHGGKPSGTTDGPSMEAGDVLMVQVGPTADVMIRLFKES